MRIELSLAAATVLVAVPCAGNPSPGDRPATPRPIQTVAAVKVPLKAPVRSMAALEEALASPDPVTRAEAASELAGAGTVPESVGNRLRAALQDDADARVRAAAVWALGHVRQGVAQADGTLQPVPYDEPPRLVHQSPLVYPPAAFDQGIEGTVVVEIVIDEEGKVVRADVRESIPVLDAAALATIGEWRFTPAKLAGKPICTMASLPVTFRITRKSTEATPDVNAPGVVVGRAPGQRV